MIIPVIIIALLSNGFMISASSHQRIGILSYGSLVNRPTHSVTGAYLSASQFEPTSVLFPITLSLLDHKQRITAVIDTVRGTPKRVYLATSHFNSLQKAMQNLAAREGAPFLKNEKKYSTEFIFYIKKISSHEKIQKDELPLQFEEWVIHDSPDSRQKLNNTLIDEIMGLAKQHSLDAVLWVSCPIVSQNSQEFVAQLIQDPVLLKNAQIYIKWLADGPQSELEHAIMGGKQKLMSLMQNGK